MRKKSLFVVAFLVVAFVMESAAQCAMCKAQLESSDDDISNNLPTGILFLMIIPYLLLMVLVAVFFKGRIRTSLRRFVNS